MRKEIGARGEEIPGQRQLQPPPERRIFNFTVPAWKQLETLTFPLVYRRTSTSTTVMSSQQNMSVNSTVDHCKTPNQVTYEILTWLMVVEFMLGLPLNLSVLYIFIFRYEETISLSLTFLCVLKVLKGIKVDYWGQEFKDNLSICNTESKTSSSMFARLIRSLGDSDIVRRLMRSDEIRSSSDE